MVPSETSHLSVRCDDAKHSVESIVLQGSLRIRSSVAFLLYNQRSEGADQHLPCIDHVAVASALDLLGPAKDIASDLHKAGFERVQLPNERRIRLSFVQLPRVRW